MDKDATIKELLDRVAFLEAELITTKEHLKKYTAPASRKEYYEKNKEAILEKQKQQKDIFGNMNLSSNNAHNKYFNYYVY